MVARSMITLVSALALLLVAARPATAQSAPRVDLSGGYQFLNLSAEDDNEALGTGWYVDIAGNLHRYVGIVFDVGGSYKSLSRSESFFDEQFTATVDLRVHQFMGGMRLNGRLNPTLVPFAEVLVGGVNVSAEVAGSATIGGTPVFSFSDEESATKFGLQAGGGVDFLFSDRVGVRVGVDYLRIFDDEGSVNAFRFAAGIVLPFAR
jgi:opacity protein-like surface antigen